eukprot:1145734-Pelagomonas_calceolata.AAC.2
MCAQSLAAVLSLLAAPLAPLAAAGRGLRYSLTIYTAVACLIRLPEAIVSAPAQAYTSFNVMSHHRNASLINTLPNEKELPCLTPCHTQANTGKHSMRLRRSGCSFVVRGNLEGITQLRQ